MQIEIIAIEQQYSSSQFNAQNHAQIKAKLTAIMQQIQTSQRNRQLKKGHARNRLKALPPPGRAPYGYRRGKDKYVIDRSTAPIVKDFFERFLLFGSIRDAVRYLEQKYGKKIAVSTGRHWLNNPVYRGDLAYQNQEIISNTHGAIISREEAAQIDRLLRRNRVLSPRSASAPRSLAGLVFCQKCQSPMKITHVTTRNKKREYLYLTPLNCPEKPACKSIDYEKILAETIQKICLELPAAVNKLNLPSPESLKTKLAEKIKSKENIIEQLPNLIKQGILDQETADIRKYKLRTEIAQIKTQIAQLPPVNLKAIASAVSLPQFWFDLSETERRFYFREFLRKISLIRCSNNDSNHWQIQLVFIF